jgi:dinuclear metal center YbgI/SA1388 family protein
MVLRKDLALFLNQLYNVENFEDGCENGLQVEGKDKITKILFGVSFNLPFIEQAINENADAVIVHHGIFQKGVFKLKGTLKQKIKIVLEHNISIFCIHLPMDVHPEIGHNALLMKSIDVEGFETFDFGYLGENSRRHTLDHILKIFHNELHPEDFGESRLSSDNSVFSLSRKYGFTVLDNGPEIPGKIAVMTGSSCDYYEKAVEKGVDTFFGGDIKEKIPAISYETRTNFVNLGHYYSEKPGVLALKNLITEKFAVQTAYIEIPNPV